MLMVSMVPSWRNSRRAGGAFDVISYNCRFQARECEDALNLALIT